MHALLLAAGVGSRLRPITDRIPKCLVPVCNRPLLSYWLDLLFHGGIERVVINTHYLPDQVQEFVIASSWRDRVDLVHEASLLGTAGTMLANRNFMGQGSFLVAHADNLTRFNLPEFVRSHERRPAEAVMTMMTFYTDDPRSCGIVELDERRVVKAFHEKPALPVGTLANAAAYIFEPTIFDFLSGRDSPLIDISTDLLPLLVGKIFTFHNEVYHRDIGTLDSLARAEREFCSYA